MEKLGLNALDIIILILLLWSAYRGYTKGFLIMGASLLALVLGIYGAIRFSDFTAGLLVSNFNLTTKYLNLIAFAITFVGIVVAVHFIARALDKLMKAVALGFVNRIAGVLFAVLKTALLLSILFVILNTINQKRAFMPEKHTENSLLYKPLSSLAPMLFPYLNFDDVRQRFKKDGPTEVQA